MFIKLIKYLKSWWLYKKLVSHFSNVLINLITLLVALPLLSFINLYTRYVYREILIHKHDWLFPRNQFYIHLLYSSWGSFNFNDCRTYQYRERHPFSSTKTICFKEPVFYMDLLKTLQFNS